MAPSATTFWTVNTLTYLPRKGAFLFHPTNIDEISSCKDPKNVIYYLHLGMYRLRRGDEVAV